MVDYEAVYDTMEAILSTVNAVFEQNLVDLPTRQYVTIGSETVHDCEQVTVSFEQIYTGTPGAQEQVPTKCSGPRSGVFIVEIVRCIPTPTTASRGGKITAPQPEELTVRAKTQAVDAWLLLQAGLTYSEEQYYLGGLADVAAGPASGGYQAMVMTLICGVTPLDEDA